MASPKPHPPPPSSWGASRIVSEATAENLLSGAEELISQQERMTEATTGLLAVVSEVGGGPWEACPGLTEKALTDWMEEQEYWVDELKERLDRKQRELVRLEEVEEEDLVPAIAPPDLDAAFRVFRAPSAAGQWSEEPKNRPTAQLGRLPPWREEVRLTHT